MNKKKIFLWLSPFLLFTLVAAGWEIDLAKMMHVSRIHGIMECKKFFMKES